MEHKYEVQTDEGNVKEITEILTGDLKAVIIRTNHRIGLQINSELGYCLYRYKDIMPGVYYIPLRANAKREDNDLIYTGVPYTLNEKLILYVAGPPNVEVEIILRLD